MKKKLLIYSILIVLVSCKRKDPYWDVDIAAPLAKSTLSLSALFADTLLQTNNDSSLSLVYYSDLLAVNADSLLKIPDTSIINNYLPIFFPGGYYVYSPSTTFPILNNNELTYAIPNGVELHDAIIRSGKIKLEVSTTLRQPTILKCYVPSAKLNGVPLTVYLPVPAGSQTSPAYADTLIDFSNYALDLRGLNGNKFNTVVQNLEIIIDPLAQNDSILYQDYFNSTINFVDIIPQYGHGYFGNQNFDAGPDTNVLDLFNQIQGGILNLNSAQVDLQIVNEFGIDLRSKINYLKSINYWNNSIINLTGSNINTSFNINRAIATGNPQSPVISTTKNISFHPGNSNITPFISNMPQALSYYLSNQVNPLGNVSGSNDFVYYGTGLKAHLNVNVPLNFSASYLGLKDTSDFTIGTISDLDKVTEGYIILKATNSYPFALSLFGNLLDENNQVVDQLIVAPDNIILAPSLDVNNTVIGSRETYIKIYLDRAKIDKLKKAKRIAFVTEFNTSNAPQTVTFYNHYKLDLLLTAEFNYIVGK